MVGITEKRTEDENKIVVNNDDISVHLLRGNYGMFVGVHYLIDLRDKDETLCSIEDLYRVGGIRTTKQNVERLNALLPNYNKIFDWLEKGRLPISDEGKMLVRKSVKAYRDRYATIMNEIKEGTKGIGLVEEINTKTENRTSNADEGVEEIENRGMENKFVKAGYVPVGKYKTHVLLKYKPTGKIFGISERDWNNGYIRGG